MPPTKPKQLTIGTFRVRQLAVQSDMRGQPMRVVDLTAVEGEALTPAKMPEGITPAGAEGQLRALLNPEAAKFLELDAQYDLVLVRKG